MPTPGSPSLNKPPASIRRGRFVLFLLWTLLVFGGGIYMGNSVTKSAMNGPDWMRRLFGVNAPTPPLNTATVPVSNTPNSPLPGNPPVNNMPQGGPMPNVGTGVPGSGGANMGNPPNTGPGPNAPASDPGFLGSWTTDEDVVMENNTSKKVTYLYTFNKDGSGTYSVDGQKTADIKWENAGDMLNLTFTTGNGSAGRFWVMKEKWFANPEKTLLTLVPQGPQDANAEMGTGGTKTLKHK